MKHVHDATAGEPYLSPVLTSILVVVSLAGLAYIATLGWNLLLPAPIFQAHMDSSCDLRNGPCSALFGDGRSVSLTISAPDPAPNQAVRPTAEPKGQDPDAVSVELRGRSMSMGLTCAPLLDIGHGLFVGYTSLPVCVRDRMTWTAAVVSSGTRGS